MPAADIADDAQKRNGWTDEFMLALAMEYIENQQSDDAWQDFLKQQEERENNDE